MPIARPSLVLTTAVAAVSVAGAALLAPASASAVRTNDVRTAVPVEDSPEVPGRLLLMLDASGSMNEKDPSGLTKIAAAKKALTGVVAALPSTATVGLRVYGATQPGGRPTRAACADTQLVHPITTLDRPGLTGAIAAFKAKGETPIAYSLQQAARDLGPSGKRNIVLVSDGQESCVPDPCPVVKQLVGSGIDLQIDTVGFGVDAKARKQLQCIADTGHGSYYDARNADQLTTSLGKLSQRALRPFTVSGTPVTAAALPEQAPALTPGQYTDSFAGKAPARYYRIKRSVPGSAIRLSLVARPSAQGDMYAQEAWKIWLATPDEVTCGYGYTTSLEATRGGNVSTVSVGQNLDNALAENASSEDKKACATADLVAKVER